MELPQGTHDLYQHLGAHGHNDQDASSDHASEKHEEHDVEAKTSPLIEHNPESRITTVRVSQIPVAKILKKVAPYAIVFVVAIGLFLLLFTNFSFKSLFGNSNTTKPKVVTQYTNLEGYSKWISGYFYEVTDSSILAPDYDISGNGLTNYQKFILGLNPKRKDTLGLGITDTQALINGINPLTGSAMPEEQKKLVAQYIDLESVSNKLSLAAAQASGMVAGASSNISETRNNVVIKQTENGSLSIPALGITVPIVWTSDVKNFDRDLQSGVIHYPGTAMPGEIGTSYISGHSSNYAWAKGDYNKIFETLANLKQYDSFSITVNDETGKKIIFHYVVTGSSIYKADDQAQFASQGKSIVALSTCWPIGTSSKRLVVFGELSQTER
ncbi:MAG: sortase [Patescibacteria group bacterium]